ncbi:MAG: DUF87 domain-containing protein [Caldilineaceae bacterium]|nr:DUF87 domain-containing protein [Caldilineaceae bacterium]
MQAPPETLGSFYLGAEYDLTSGERTDAPILYDARDLTTHAVCVGMTGSGKTGLCVGLLEEAALDKVPAILIDPKGDITNLLLQFPELQPSDFQPWINPDDARRKDKSIEEYAQSTAELWRNGLADWGIDGARIRTTLETANYTIFTPGSDAGVPVNVMGSLAAPKLDFDANAEAIRERISGTVAALLGLIELKADPVTSREAILLSNIFEHYWRKDEDLDLAKIITAVQKPPMAQLGVFDTDTFFPPDDRFKLAMLFNNLMASPTFQSWLTGEPLDVDKLFYSTDGTPRHSVFYIAHLSESQRAFFVTLLLESLVTWMRRQDGTTSLRALLYFDEVFGFFPPTAEPPTKKPLMTLLKQARAFGLGVVLVTQNPVDIDYKGLTNAGTWFIGKLQAERDKERVLAGLTGALAEAGADTSIDFDEVISRLGSRVFLLHNVHEDRPVVFHTRWAQSYLRGPLTRTQVSRLQAERGVTPETTATPALASPPVAATGTPTPAPTPAPAPTPTPVPASTPPSTGPEAPAGYIATPPGMDPGVDQVYLPITRPEREAIQMLNQEVGRADITSVQIVYDPVILGAATVSFLDRKHAIQESVRLMLAARPTMGRGQVDWENAEQLKASLRDLHDEPPVLDSALGPFFAPPPESANSSSELKTLRNELDDWLYYNQRLPLNYHAELDILQRPGESEREFQLNVRQAARERRDDEVDKLEEKYANKIATIEDRKKKEERELAEDEADYQSRKQEEWAGIGESALNFVLGRRSSRYVSRAMSKRRMTANAKADIDESIAQIAEYEEDIKELNEELKGEIEEISAQWEHVQEQITKEELKPRRTDVQTELLALAWRPSWYICYDDGYRTRTATIPATE